MAIKIINKNRSNRRISTNPFSPIPSGTSQKCKVINLKGDDENVFTTMQKALKKKHVDDDTLIDCVIVLGYNCGVKFSDFKKTYPDKKIIVYQLEQIATPKNLWWDENSEHQFVRNRTSASREWLFGCDLIWDMSVENIEFMVQKGIYRSKIMFKPIEYSDAFVYPMFDVIFYGSISKKRLELLNEVAKRFKLCVIGVWHLVTDEEKATAKFQLLPPKHGEDLWGYINRSKIVLNIHIYSLQEQVRIGELLANGKCVITEKSDINYFGNLVSEFETKEEMISLIELNLKRDKWRESASISNINRYKNIDYSKFVPPLKTGAIYNSFYDLELLETSIKSIREVVKYIVVVHQRVSFSGEKHPANSEEILANLVRRGFVDDVVYYENKPVSNPQVLMLDKRNIGLEYCKKNGCQYVMPMDNDECYNAKELANEIAYMSANNISTLYSKILAYWHDENHYFEDTYLVPSVYQIDERKFEITKSSVLCDPVRKMKEKNFRISEMPMHHLTYLKGHFEHKGVSNLRNVYYKDIFAQILSRFNSWQPGDKAAVFANDLTKGGELYVKEVDLITTEKMF